MKFVVVTCVENGTMTYVNFDKVVEIRPVRDQKKLVCRLFFDNGSALDISPDFVIAKRNLFRPAIGLADFCTEGASAIRQFGKRRR